MKVSVQSVVASEPVKKPKQRSVLEWKIKLPSIWVKAAAANGVAEKKLLKKIFIRQKDDLTFEDAEKL